jgi:hypothetical protein
LFGANRVDQIFTTGIAAELGEPGAQLAFGGSRISLCLEAIER